MTDTNVATRYALALYQVVMVDDQIKTDDALQAVSQALSEANIQQFLLHPKTTLSIKYKLVEALDLTFPLKPFLLLVLEKRRELLLPAIAQEFHELINQANNTASAHIKSAIPLNQNRINQLKLHLEQLTNKTICVKTTVDESLLGGLTIEIDGRVLDLSLNNELKQLTKSLG